MLYHLRVRNVGSGMALLLGLSLVASAHGADLFEVLQIGYSSPNNSVQTYRVAARADANTSASTAAKQPPSSPPSVVKQNTTSTQTQNNGCGCDCNNDCDNGNGRRRNDRSEDWSNCGCNGSYKWPVPPLYTYHWPGIYSQQLMTDYQSPWRFPPLRPYVEEGPIKTTAAEHAVRSVSVEMVLAPSRSQIDPEEPISEKIKRYYGIR